MINKFIKQVFTASVSAVLLLSTSAHAMLVFDPANYSQTTITAIQAVEAEITRINQLKIQIQDNISNFAGVDIAGLKNEYSKIKGVYDSAKKLQTSIAGVKNDFENVKSLFGSGNYKTFDQFVGDIKRRAAAGDAIAKNMFSNAQNAQTAMQTAFEQHEKLVDKASSVNGMTEAAQSTTAAVGILIQQQNAMIAMMSSDQVAKAVETTAATQKKKQDDDFGAAYKKRIADELASMIKKFSK